ncbi:TraR/DksA C4-type zinc finger protein [Gilvimarinus agarilyticus]|uniref:TraR/DksA C4-type zinc finger protein n=1 Tax=unclassified Gilvimarinus TaxID=2642066 RepID=UPI001C082D99|nr:MULTISPECIES: TraR/DksA C4-type zinc finger protein [unclassified Gilvimarinus]MBU2884352.1 TraR/DksA C4-type zinc finger protein [Gilvimarinus agarilyticus]MDO6569488.1 TraR/DksA C4-type zinc finger protein [Gilvimarinus sp. 2_MG-2023]MDO6748175.1 TraR/DksA C4-type zinc finger protein [Gilvimarinus sp. 1_MG-2023]
MLTEQQLRQAPAADYMNDAQQDFFKNYLLNLKQQTQEHIETIKQQLAHPPECNDEADRAQLEDDMAIKLRLADREYRLLRKIDSSLRRLQTGEYGYCQETGEPIGIERLLIRPTAEFGTDIKVISEQKEKFYAN